MAVTAGFAGVALLLAVTGIYAVVSFAVERRTREAAARMAIGARPARVAREMAWHGVAPAVVGMAAGPLLSLPAAAALRSQLFGVLLSPFRYWSRCLRV